MNATRTVMTITVLVAIATIFVAGFAIMSQQFNPAPSNTETSTYIETTTVTVFQNVVSPMQKSAMPPKTTITQNVTIKQVETVTRTVSRLNGTIGVYYQVANYSIVPVKNGIQPIYLGSLYDLFIPMHEMDWYTVSCGAEYNITGTIFYYNIYPPYKGVGNLELAVNATYLAVQSGTQILSVTSPNGTSNVPFTSIFTAC